MTKKSSSRLSFLNVARFLSVVSLPLSIVQSLIFLIYVVKLKREEFYFHGITAEVIVHACLIYAVFFRKPGFLIPYVIIQIIAGLYYVFLALNFGWEVLQKCGSFFNCSVEQDRMLNDRARFMLLASFTIPFQCAVAAIMVKAYRLLSQKKEEHVLAKC